MKKLMEIFKRHDDNDELQALIIEVNKEELLNTDEYKNTIEYTNPSALRLGCQIGQAKACFYSGTREDYCPV